MRHRISTPIAAWAKAVPNSAQSSGTCASTKEAKCMGSVGSTVADLLSGVLLSHEFGGAQEPAMPPLWQAG